MIRRLGTVAASVVTLGLTSPAEAQTSDWTNGRYDVFALGDGCAMTSNFAFDGRSDIRFTLYQDDEGVMFGLTSLDWTDVDEQVFEDFAVFFYPEEIIYTPVVTGYTEGVIYHGFMGAYDDAFLDHIAQQRRLIMGRLGDDEEADMVVVADLNLVGTATAVARLRSCAAAVSRQNAEQERREAQWDYMARDPFAENER